MGDPDVLRAKRRLNTFKNRKMAKFWRREKAYFQKKFESSTIFSLKFLKLKLIFKRKIQIQISNRIHFQPKCKYIRSSF